MKNTHNNNLKIKPLSRLIAMGCLAIAAAGCNLNTTDTDKNNGVTVYPTEPEHNFAAPKAGQETFSRLRQEGKYWVNEQNEVVSLRGLNLGNWLTLETWMMNSGENPVGEGIVDQCSFEAKLSERFGADEKERLMDLYRDSYITERDWDIMAQAGFNVIRLPFPYDLIENDANPKTLRDDAWVYLDKAINAAKARQMYVILDLHGAAGRQGWEHHSGCEGLNEFWGGEQANPDLALAAENQDRTKWLWQQIANRYKNEPAIAGYGLINEPWGTSAENLAAVSTELYQAIREVDQQTIVILPGHNSGIQAYGEPAENGLENVAVEMHFYPGIFDDLGISYKTQRDWLTCGLLGNSGVCDWDNKINQIQTPFLIGEMQPWTGLGEQGGAITRATFDKYNDMGWAGTVWSYKVTTRDGGQGNGTWGLVTNKGDRLLTKADTWACAGWESDFAQACGQAPKIVTPTDDDQTFYLVIKSGSFGGGQDIQLDNIQLIEQSTGQNILANSSFDADSNWLEWSATDADATHDKLSIDVNYPQDANNSVLRISALEGDGFVNGGAYQVVELKGGESYLLSGTFADKGSVDTWAEIYLLPTAPVNGQDVNGSAMPTIDLNNSSLTEIENYFKLQATIEYDKHQGVIDALTAEQAPVIFNLPYRPVNLSLVEDEATNTIDLIWKAVDGANYNVYRSNVSGRDYQLIAENIETPYYTDTEKPEGTTGYYTVTAVNTTDESYYAKEVASAFSAFDIPGLIQAENYIAQTGFELENTSDEGGGQNTGHAQTGDTLEYLVNITEAGDYTVEFRFATETGSQGFVMSLDGNEIATVSVPSTGGWQTWQSVSQTITIETTGDQTLKLEAIDDEWNFNWMRFSKN
ncbi:cellulase family glycosylhydrolase [Catenovulum sp. 2E275]|uniref:cellulase family glycosylhydrolase n=1 Tax=Catenovulum sp. 2E275 TaxID=2980497 RepID=UPI0021D1A3CF|nr:cellulase family glycosylhydrolase [Catenovulum sp. 2E275]MCU4675962.1 cellulase family glycosylhydrolase [Catenovulum sp. 2E275]